eukprot:TRINITY_DN5292_c0_g1_i2.p1 TRINITY_DN5292_c0_g1~~TRINITY_DN5292_c0_g1_i2.p1  ORF type:complete len:1627 (+),score=208.47 TRINITY_DN5292_c0_g1_i2:341-4882(+)
MVEMYLSCNGKSRDSCESPCVFDGERCTATDSTLSVSLSNVGLTAWAQFYKKQDACSSSCDDNDCSMSDGECGASQPFLLKQLSQENRDNSRVFRTLLTESFACDSMKGNQDSDSSSCEIEGKPGQCEAEGEKCSISDMRKEQIAAGVNANLLDLEAKCSQSKDKETCRSNGCEILDDRCSVPKLVSLTGMLGLPGDLVERERACKRLTEKNECAGESCIWQAEGEPRCTIRNYYVYDRVCKQELIARPACDDSTLPSRTDVDASMCRTQMDAGEACSVKCAKGFEGPAEVWRCNDGLKLEGIPPACQRSVCRDVVALQSIGVITEDCANVVTDSSCTATCSAGYQRVDGTSNEFVCGRDGTLRPTGIVALRCQPIVCSNGLPAGFDNRRCEGTTVGKRCAVSCPQGESGDMTFYTCTESGVFEGAKPTCRPKICFPKRFTQLGVNASNCRKVHVGGTCKVFCQPGYENATVEYGCDSDQTLSGQPPTCRLKSCQPSPALDSERIAHTCSDRSHGDVCLASCSQGFQGSTQLHKCDGLATDFPFVRGTPPSCTGIACERRFPKGIGVDASNCSGKTTGKNCSLSCKHGFDAVQGSSSTVLCLSDGTFSSPSFQCERATCRNLSMLADFADNSVSTSCTDIPYGRSCVVMCSPGYISVDPITLLCDLSNEFSSTGGFRDVSTGTLPSPPKCSPQQCTFGLPTMRGVNHDCVGKTTGSTCTVFPAVGFSGENVTLLCEPGGYFSGPTPAVSPEACENLALTGVGSNCNNKTSNTTCWAYCVAGYSGTIAQYSCEEAVGGTTIQLRPVTAAVGCTRRLRNLDSIDATKGRRLSSCDTAAVLQAGLSEKSLSHDCDDTANGDRCVVACGDGYEIDGQAEIWECSGGVLNGSVPTCSPLPCVYNEPTGIDLVSNCTSVKTGETCVVTCRNGYQLASGETPESFSCGATREFIGNLPRCEPEICESLLLSAEYSHSCAGKATGDSCHVGCADGWIVNGSASIYRCTASGFDGSLPTCQASRCTEGVPVDADIRAERSCGELTTGSNCTVSCADGFVGNSQTFTCATSGSLEGSLPNCTRGICRGLASEDLFEHDCSEMPFESNCSVLCGDGFELEGSPGAYTCVWDTKAAALTLKGNFPKCAAKECTAGIPTQPWISHNCSKSKTGQACTVECDGGYDGMSTELKCDSSGLLTGSLPRCTAKRCDKRVITGVVDDCVDGSLVVEGDVCSAMCAGGYSPTAGGQSIVQWRCAWNAATRQATLVGNDPSCEPVDCLYGLPTGSGVESDCVGTRHNATCTASCRPGFVGSPTVFRCFASRSLQGQTPDCTPRKCDHIPPVGEVLLCDDAFPIVGGAPCTATCAPGYGVPFNSAASAERLCEWDTVLSATRLVGTPLLCKALPCLHNETAGSQFNLSDCDNTVLHETCVVTCTNGYDGDSRELTCGPGRTFTGQHPNCIAATTSDQNWATRSSTSGMHGTTSETTPPDEISATSFVRVRPQNVAGAYVVAAFMTALAKEFVHP